MEMKATGTLCMVTERKNGEDYIKLFHDERNARMFVQRKTRNGNYNTVGRDFWQEVASVCPHTFSIKTVCTYD